MEHVLVGLTWKTTVPYLDDCIIFAATPEEHLERLQAVLQRIREANLKINPLKCEFFKTKVHFLGHVLSADGLQVDPEKIAAVKKFPIPTSQTEVKSFLGLCSNYRRYVENFAEIARPLHKLTESSPSFGWTPEAQTAFNSSSTPPNDSHFSFPINEGTFYFVHRRKLDCNGRCSRSGSKWQRTCHLQRFQGFLKSSNQIFCNQAGAFGNCPLHTPFSTLPSGSQVYHRYGSLSTSVAAQLQRP